MPLSNALRQLEERMQALDEYELPAEFTSPKTPPAHQADGMDEYKLLRDEYLQSNLENSLLHHVKAKGLTDIPDNDDKVQLANLHERHGKATQALKDAAARMILAENELLVDHALLKERKTILRNMLEEFRQKHGEEEDWTPSFPEDMDEDVDEKISREMAEQEETILNLARKKIEMEAKLEHLQQQAKELEKKNMALDLPSPQSLQDIEKENEELQQQLDQMNTIKSDYELRRLLMEELCGIEIEKVEEARSKGGVLLTNVTLVLLRSQRLCVTLETKVTPSSQGMKTQISSAHFVVQQGIKNDEIYLPPLDDLIPTARDFAEGIILHPSNGSNHTAGFRFLVHQALWRLETYRARKTEVDELREVCGSVQVRRNPTDPEDHLFQQVLCTWAWDGSTVTVLLRLTPDCPSVSNSIFLESLSCPEHNLEQFQARMQTRQAEFSSPLDFVMQIQQALVSGDWKDYQAF